MNLIQAILQHLGIAYDASKSQYRCNSPLRTGSDSNSFSIKIDERGGTYHDHVSGESGTLTQLADTLGITYTRSTTSKRSYMSGNDYAAQHGVAWKVLEQAGWSEIKYMRRPALRIETAHGPRYRFLDYRDEQTYINEKGFTRCWYLMSEAVRMARATSQPLVYCNGECSAVVAMHYGVPALTVAGGGENAIPASLLDELKQLYTGSIIVALDCDAKGRAASQKLVSQLRLAGYTAYAVDLNLGAGGDIADYCKLYQHESMQQLLTLKPPSQEVEYKTTFNTISAADLDKKRFAALKWIVEDILPEGCFVLAGKPKSRKSWLTTHIARTVAMGGKVFGQYATHQGSVLYMDLESNQRRMQSRLQQMERDDEGQPANMFITNTWQRGELGVADLDIYLTEHKCALVVIDILENIRAPRTKHGNPYTEDYDAVKPYNELAEKHHCCILMVHHTRKSRSEDAFDEISGTTGLVGGVAGMLILSRIPTKETHSELMVRGRDIEHDDKRVLKWNDHTSSHELESDPAQAYMSDERMEIMRIIGSAHMRVQDIAHEAGKSRQAVHKLLQKLCGLGALAQDEVGKYYAPQERSYPAGYDAPAEPVQASTHQPALFLHTLPLIQQQKLQEKWRAGDSATFTQICAVYGIGSQADRIWGELCQLDTQ